MIYRVVGVLAVLVIFRPRARAGRVPAAHSREEYFSGSGFDLARIFLDRMGRSDIRVEAVTEGSHYDPVTKAVRLKGGQCGGRPSRGQKNFKGLRTRLHRGRIGQFAELFQMDSDSSKGMA